MCEAMGEASVREVIVGSPHRPRIGGKAGKAALPHWVSDYLMDSAATAGRPPWPSADGAGRILSMGGARSRAQPKRPADIIFKRCTRHKAWCDNLGTNIELTNFSGSVK